MEVERGSGLGVYVFQLPANDDNLTRNKDL